MNLKVCLSCEWAGEEEICPCCGEKGVPEEDIPMAQAVMSPYDRNELFNPNLCPTDSTSELEEKE